MTKKLTSDEKAYNALMKAVELTKTCTDSGRCDKCLFRTSGCGAYQVRNAILDILNNCGTKIKR